MEVDRRAFLATLGVGTVGMMSHEDRAESLEHYMMDELDSAISPPKPAEISEQREQRRAPRGTGRLFMPRDELYEPMPAKIGRASCRERV